MRFELPEELAGLEEPRFILMPPAGIQYAFLSILLVLSLAGVGWFFHSLLSGTVSGGQILALLISVPALAVGLRRSYWRRWASFACDRNGIFLARTSPPNFTFKPWSEVGGAYIGKAGDSTDVILKVRFSKDEWYRHIGHDWDYPVREDGYVHCGTGQQCRDVNNTLQSIEKVWKLSGTASDLQLGLKPDEVVPPNKFVTVFTMLFLSVFCSGFLFLGFMVNLDLTKRALRNRSLIASGRKANGTVIDYAVGTGGRSRSYAPIVSFVTADGKAIQFESLHHPNYTGNVPGDPVPVLYDPDDPSIAEINEPERLWGGVSVGLAVGTLFMFIGGGGIIFVVRRVFSGGNNAS